LVIVPSPSLLPEASSVTLWKPLSSLSVAM
jgi:hypothetical protein